MRAQGRESPLRHVTFALTTSQVQHAKMGRKPPVARDDVLEMARVIQRFASTEAQGSERNMVDQKAVIKDRSATEKWCQRWLPGVQLSNDKHSTRSCHRRQMNTFDIHAKEEQNCSVPQQVIFDGFQECFNVQLESSTLQHATINVC